MRHSSPWHTAEVWLIKDEFRGSTTVLIHPLPLHHSKMKKRKEMGAREGRVHSDHLRPTLWMGHWPWERDGETNEVRTERKSKKKNEYSFSISTPVWCLWCASVTIALFLQLASALSLHFMPLHRSSLITPYFLNPSLCPLPADLCQPPWNHCHIRAFNRRCLASCSLQTYYSLFTHANVSVCICKFVFFFYSFSICNDRVSPYIKGWGIFFIPTKLPRVIVAPNKVERCWLPLTDCGWRRQKINGFHI